MNTEIFKSWTTANILNVSISQLYGLVEIAFFDEQMSRYLQEKRYSTKDIALLKLAHDVHKQLRWPFQKQTEFFRKLKKYGEGTILLRFNGESHQITLKTDSAVLWVEKRINEIRGK